jgi:5-formaminoimidazole-4-carboxamide-1-(beta)-D-ribofuranosyl 5'-monophosphate synthetase
MNRLPAREQALLDAPTRMIEVGHIPVTIRESLLEKLFEAGHALVTAVDELVKPGLTGPFTLQLMVTPELDIVVYDVAFRIGGGTNAYMGIGSQYSKLYFGKPISMGRRIAMELKMCTERKCIGEITT